MVNIVFTAISVAVLVVAVAARGNNALTIDKDNTEVLSANIEQEIEATSQTPEPVQTPTETQLPEAATPSPTPSPTIAPTQQPTVKPVSVTVPSFNASEWVYQGSSIVAQSNSSVTLNASTDAKAITTWYREKFTTLGYRTTSFIQTQSNEKVLNKLAGASNSGSVLVEITQESASAAVSVKVVFTQANTSI